jgi:dTDP-4-dehydrorhamnose 3,5-epimerase-like enzyme
MNTYSVLEKIVARLSQTLSKEELFDLIELIKNNNDNKNLEIAIQNKLESSTYVINAPQIIAKTLEYYETLEGITIPIYNDLDLKGNVDNIKMIYVTTVNPGMSKGPIIHRIRNSTVMAVGGEGVIEWQDLKSGPNDPKWCYPMTSEIGKPLIVHIPPLIPVMYQNFSAESAAVFVIIADYAWHPNDDESVKYNGWDEYYASKN